MHRTWTTFEMERELWARYYDAKNQAGTPEEPPAPEREPARPGHKVQHRVYADLSPADQFEADMQEIEARAKAVRAEREGRVVPTALPAGAPHPDGPDALGAGEPVTPEEALRLLGEARR